MPSPLRLLHVLPDHKVVCCAPNVTDEDQVFVCGRGVQLGSFISKADVEDLDPLCFRELDGAGRKEEIEVGKELEKQGRVNPGAAPS